MVGNYERLAELSEEAADSEDAALIQQLKTMDSIETKLNQLKVTFQEFYTSSGVEDLIKGILDFVTRIINTMNSMPKLFGKIPVAAIGVVAQIIGSLKNLSTKLLGVVDNLAETLAKKIKEAIHDGVDGGLDTAEDEINKRKNEKSSNNNKPKTEADKKREAWTNSKGAKALGVGGTIASAVGTALTSAGIMTATGSNRKSGLMQAGGAILSIGGAVASGAATGGLPGAIIGGIIGLVGQIPTFISAFGEFTESAEEKVAKMTQAIEDAEEKTLLSKNELKTLENYRKKYEELSLSKNDSNEAYQEWLDLNNEIASVYPSLISSMDAEGNYVVSLGDAYEKLVKEKKANYLEDLKSQGLARIKAGYTPIYNTSKYIAGEKGSRFSADRLLSANFRNSELTSYQRVADWRKNGVASSFMEDLFAADSERIARYSKGGDQGKAKGEGQQGFVSKFFLRSGIGELTTDGSSKYLNASWVSPIDTDLNATVVDKHMVSLFESAETAQKAQLELVSKAEEFFLNVESKGYLSLEKSFELAAQALGYKGTGENGAFDFSWLTTEGYGSALTAMYLGGTEEQKQLELNMAEYLTSAVDGSNLQEAVLSKRELEKWYADTSVQEYIKQQLAAGKDAGEVYGQAYLDYIQTLDPEGLLASVSYITDEQEDFYAKLFQYSKKNREKKMAELGITENEELKATFDSAVETQMEPAIKRFSIGFAESFKYRLDESGKVVNEAGEEMATALEAIINNSSVEYLDEILAQYKEAQKSSVEGLTIYYDNIWAQINSIVDGDVAQQVATLVAKGDLTTLTGILTLVDSVEELDSTTADTIEALTTVINVNLQTEWRLFSEKITTSLESLGEALNKASSGMNLKEAQEMASKLGVSITDFELVDGQFFYHNLEALENAYLEQYATLREQLKSETQSQIDFLGELRGVDETSSIKEFWSEENQTLFNTYFEDWKEAKKTGEFQDTFYKYVEQQLRQMEQENLAVTDEYLRQQVAQITRERLEQIYDTISNGISGSMSESEFSQLDYYLKENGYNFTLQTYETAEGLKLTEDSVLRVYEILKQIDALAAQVVLDELTESAMEAEEKFNNIYEVIEHIAKINKEIATTKDSEREAALRRELALAENIRDTLMEAGDAFNFMNQDLPTGYTNPLSAWEGMGDAWKVLDGDDFKAGYIDYTDLYNMINMMESAGVDLEKAGFSFNGKALTTSELMQAAGQALVNVDGETFVDLSKLGTQFQFGAEGMKEGLMKGIKIIAKSQIELLDAEIAMLETVVKTEEAFESIDTDENKGILSSEELKTGLFGDIDAFKSGKLDEESKIYEWLLERKDWAIQIGDETWTILEILEALKDSNTKNRETLLEYLVSFINGEYSRVEGIDWSVKGGKLFKNGLEIELPPITFSSSENFPFTDLLDTWEGEDDLIDFNEKFKTYLKDNNKTTFTPADLIEFADEAGYSDAFINWLINHKDEMINQARRITTQEGQVASVRWDVEYETWVSDSGKLYDEQGHELSREEVLQRKLDEIAKQQGISELTLESLKIQLTDEGWVIEGQEKAFSLTDILNFVQKQIEQEQKNNQSTPLEIIPETRVAPKVDNVPIEVKPSEVTLDYSLLEDGKLEVSTRGREGEELSVIVDSISVSGNEVFYSVDGREMTAEQIVARLGLDISTEEGQQALSDLQNSTETLKDSIGPLKTSSQIAEEKIDGLDGSLASVATQAEIATQKLNNVASSLNSIASGYSNPGRPANATHAKGNVGNAKATGTLMGELGPELYVTGGRYYVAGQNGAEFVNLPSDAIVFNHLQTRRLLENGSVNGTGKPVTNERNAVAMATGTTGPAKASASDALEELKEIRAMWQGLLNASAQDFSKKAGSGSGGGGGEDDKAFMHDLERWYNLLRQIAKLEQQITYEQIKRENMRSGYNHVQSLEKELALLKKQQKAHQLLSDLQKDYYDKRRKELLSTDYSKIFTYDDEGLMQYVDGKNRGLDILATLNETDEHGKALMTAKQQVQYLKDLGFDISKFQINADGSKVKSNDYQTMMQIFWDGVDGWMAELDELYDSYNDSMTSVEESIQAQNEILQEYIDNQLSVEERLMDAIVSREEAEIERLEKELDALEEATDKYLDGLKDSLDREKQMYERNKDSEETAKLQRQLAILKRTGGSASEIQSLQDEISSRLEDSYFQQQEDQIDALEQAANNQIEKLQTQIDIMNETLEYQKANGLLWEEVYEMMNNWSPEQMLQFIEEYLPSYRENSALQNDEDSKEALKEFEIWVGKRENTEALANAWQNYYNSVDQYSDEFKAEHAEGAKNAYSLAYATKGEEEAKKAADAYYAEMAKPSVVPPKIEEEQPKPEAPTADDKNQSGGGKKTESSNGASGDIAPIETIQSKLNNFLTHYAIDMEQLVVDGIKGNKTRDAIKEFQATMGLTTDGIVGKKTWEKLVAFKTGGLVDFTGPAWVDGTKTKPEAFLSAEDTAMLKSKIFDNNKFSLRSVVELFEGFNDSNRNITTNNDQGVVFENIQITIESGTIANDYDARRAGEMALEEMLKISRKATNRIVSRR